jgi:hypothetical protein
MKLPYTINLLPDGSVVHQDGEYLGTWHIDDLTDAFHVFTPDGADKFLFMDPDVLGLCQKIEGWMNSRS